ncbi:MAG: capsular polysaccharide biosynthesis protein [Planktomarina sp.]
MAPRFGWPSANGKIMVWGHRPSAKRGRWVSTRTHAQITTVEDAFFRSIQPGRSGDAPLGLLVDHNGCHYDSSHPSDLETILATHPLDDPKLLQEARDCMGLIAEWKLSKYNATHNDTPPPPPGYILVIDQTRGDASIPMAGGSADHFAQMLSCAKAEHPNTPILIKTHPETQAGHRLGHFSQADTADNITLWDHPTPVQDLFAGAKAVYTVSSQMGFEAILAGHRPTVFAQPFYMGWGLSDDRMPLPRRTRNITAAQILAAVCILYPIWYDPYRKEVTNFRRVLEILHAQKRAWQEDRKGWNAYNIRLWKRPELQKAFGRIKPLRFEPKTPQDRPSMVWGMANGPKGGHRLEDGFLRSNGLGAALVPPMSLVCDDLGIYFDATRPSRLETLIAQSVDLPQIHLNRAENLRQAIIAAGVTKYNLPGQSAPQLPQGLRILVPGQVEDDASLRFGGTGITTNAALLAKVRSDFPDAIIAYKPHPDVEAGLRPGHVDHPQQWADVVWAQTNATTALAAVDRVATMTSLMGFEALLRGMPVHCYGHPFYAGWGLTRDVQSHNRRTAKPSLAGLIHATLIDYPRYFDPETGLPCPPEVIVDRLNALPAYKGGAWLRLLSKAQGIMASQAHWWRG